MSNYSDHWVHVIGRKGLPERSPRGPWLLDLCGHYSLSMMITACVHKVSVGARSTRTARNRGRTVKQRFALDARVKRAAQLATHLHPVASGVAGGEKAGQTWQTQVQCDGQLGTSG